MTPSEVVPSRARCDHPTPDTHPLGFQPPAVHAWSKQHANDEGFTGYAHALQPYCRIRSLISPQPPTLCTSFGSSVDVPQVPVWAVLCQKWLFWPQHYADLGGASQFSTNG